MTLDIHSTKSPAFAEAVPVVLEGGLLPLIRRGRGRPKVRSDEEQMADIIEGATALFLKTGYFSMRMDDISADRGISKRTLYRLFPSKLELFRAMVREQMSASVDFTAGDFPLSMPIDERLKAVFMPEMHAHTGSVRTSFFRQVAVDSIQSPELAEIVRAECLDGPKVRLRNLFADWTGEGAMHVDDPAAAASMLVDMIVGPLLLHPNSDAVHHDDSHFVATCIRYFVNGVR